MLLNHHLNTGAYYRLRVSCEGNPEVIGPGKNAAGAIRHQRLTSIEDVPPGITARRLYRAPRSTQHPQIGYMCWTTVPCSWHDHLAKRHSFVANRQDGSCACTRMILSAACRCSGLSTSRRRASGCRSLRESCQGCGWSLAEADSSYPANHL